MDSGIVLKPHIDILGHGATVRDFLRQATRRFPGLSFRVITRSRVYTEQRVPNGDYRLLDRSAGDAEALFYCCSANEEAILRRTGCTNRLAVASENVRIARSLAEFGMFRSGAIFVLTNPSEIVSEAIRSISKNPRVYALGISVDRRRYKDIFGGLGISNAEMGDFRLAGNHWDHPYPVLDRSSKLGTELKRRFGTGQRLADRLRDLLRRKIGTELRGFKPPVERGAEALLDAVWAITTRSELEVSGFTSVHSSCVAGVYNPKQDLFRPTGDPGSVYLGRILSRQRRIVESLLTIKEPA